MFHSRLSVVRKAALTRSEALGFMYCSLSEYRVKDTSLRCYRFLKNPFAYLGLYARGARGKLRGFHKFINKSTIWQGNKHPGCQTTAVLQDSVLSTGISSRLSVYDGKTGMRRVSFLSASTCPHGALNRPINTTSSLEACSTGYVNLVEQV